MSDLKKQLKYIREDLISLYNAVYTAEEQEERENNGEACSLYDYFSDVLDFEYTINSNKEYIGVKVWVTLGGPNIWIDTRHCEVCGAWGSERETLPIPSEIRDEIDAIFSDIYDG